MKIKTNNMAKNLFFLILFFISLAISSNTCDQNENNPLGSENNITNPKINDGPYIFIENNILIEKSIINGNVITKELPFDSIKTEFEPELPVYENVKTIAALSDIHGQYALAINILKNNKIINENLNWAFGKGHLVIVGDILDRGDKVTEMLWFVYNLEKQAEESGGKIHYLLGNHECMVLHNDLRYIHDKYVASSNLLNTTYPELFGKQTILGRWLRSKATVVKINDNLFNHAGISEEFISGGFDLDEVNKLMRESLDRDKEEMKAGPFYEKYYGKKGPIWYRGYFRDNLKENQINTLLSKLNVKHIIVGHTSQKRIEQLYNKKIFNVDSSIKNGEYGEILFIEDGLFFRGTKDGVKIQID